MNKRKGRIVPWLCLICVLLSALGLRGELPLKRSNEETAYPAKEAVSVSGTGEDVRVASRLWELLFGKEKDKEDCSPREVLLVTGGGVFGARVKTAYVCVSDVGEAAGISAGDIIKSINGECVTSISDVKRIVAKHGEGELSLECERGGKRFEAKLRAKKIGEEYRLGISLKDSAAGIGTVTYIDPESGLFGGLGHGICDTDTGEPIEIIGGEVTGVILGGVQKGESGKPGELRGILTDKHLGEVYENSKCGIFGRLDNIPVGIKATPIKTASRDEVHEGEATIISTIKNGAPKEYKIKIFDVNRDSDGSKSFKIKVTDPALIALTGGIVRGMSGSPIIQDGKLVGAVTHVMVADPTEGYGIFIENMLSASENARGELPKAA